MTALPERTVAKERQALVAACRQLAALGLIGAGEGNVSLRLGPERVLTTPSGSNKRRLQAHELVITDLTGATIAGPGRPSSELAMHLAVYRARADVRAIVHAHPPTTIALTLAGIDLAAPMMPEVVTALGGIPTAPYATPSTPELAEGVARTLGRFDACLMERHGALAVGRNIDEALDRMETVERVAQVVLRARLLGSNPTPLPPVEVEKLLRLSGRS